MRPAKATDQQIFARLSDVFRRKGYEGASYAELMAATGLVKASLYHRFPGGKEEMVDAILSQVDRTFSDYVLRPAWEEGPPRERARQMALRLGEFYGSGTRWCLLDTLTLSSTPRTMKHARRSMMFWIKSFERIGRDAGLPPTSARRRAEDAVSAIEGGLIVSRVLKDRRPFKRALASLPIRLTAAAGTQRTPPPD